MSPNWVYTKGDESRISLHTVCRFPAPASPPQKYITVTGDYNMPDVKKYTEKTEVETETRHDSDVTDSEHKEKTTVKTERTVEKDREPIIIIEEK